jgi:hypothetical protein
VQAIITRAPSSIDQLWRSGVLPSLVTTLAKRHASSEIPLSAIASPLTLLRPAAGQQPWYAGSVERQQFALFMAASMGSRVVLGLLSQRMVAAVGGGGLGAAPPVTMLRSVADITPELQRKVATILSVRAVAGQLVCPPLLQHLEAAAPALAPEARELPVILEGLEDFPNMGDLGGGHQLVGMRLVPEAANLLTGLASHLDPLALGWCRPGCYYPSCSSLAGASEADMLLKRCSGCKIARWGWLAEGGGGGAGGGAWAVQRGACAAVVAGRTCAPSVGRLEMTVGPLEPSTHRAAEHCCPPRTVRRYCSPECSKAHWKYHKSSCRRVAAAAAAAGAAAGEQQG